MTTRDIAEFFAFYFLLLQVFSIIYLNIFWSHFNVDFFDYVSLQDVIFSSGGFFIKLTLLLIVFLVFFYDFNPIKSKNTKKILLVNLVIFSVMMVFTTFGAFYLPYKYEEFWHLSLFLLAISVSYVSRYLVFYYDNNLLFLNKKMIHVYVFVLISGFSSAFLFASWDSRNLFENKLGDVKYVTIKDCEDCHYWLIGMLGDFSFVSTGAEDKVFAFPKNNIESITHYFGD